MKRRSFLKKVGGTTAAASAGAFSMLQFPRGAQAAGWGSWPADKLPAILPPEYRARNVLELHVNGGMSAFDTFYTIPQWGDSDYRFLWVYSENAPVSAGLPDFATLEGRWEQCNNTALQPGNLYVPFGATDSAGNEVHLGPWAWPFRARPDVLDRMRIVVMSHDVPAHEGANPISFTGTRLGQPRMAGLGTAIQRYYTENPDVEGGGGVRAAPYSYVVYPAGYKPFNAVSASTVGFHPGSARPLIVSVSPNSELSQLLARGGIDDPAAFDQAIGYYRASYEARFRKFGHSAAARSAERDNFEFADFARRNAPELTNILESELFQSIPGPSTLCGDPFAGQDMPRMQARMAASLLTRPTDAARYVLWIDAGVEPAVTGGHDVHNRSIELNGQNLPHTFGALLDIIRDPTNPQPDDDQKIDLDETMIVINTEFGRTPDAQNQTGTNHHPEGYVNIFIGGPVTGRSVYGTMRESDGFANGTFVRPAENRIMVLQTLGIYPFSSQSYAVADVPGTMNELEAATRVRDELLGLDV